MGLYSYSNKESKKKCHFIHIVFNVPVLARGRFLLGISSFGKRFQSKKNKIKIKKNVIIVLFFCVPPNPMMMCYIRTWSPFIVINLALLQVSLGVSLHFCFHVNKRKVILLKTLTLLCVNTNCSVTRDPHPTLSWSVVCIQSMA